MSRMERHTMRVPGWESPYTKNFSLVLAIRLIRKYGDRIPTKDQVMQDFEVSRATAYRWVRSIREARETA